MLKVKSFKITDDVGINEALTKYNLAANMHILVSEGSVCIPLEDGEPENNDQRLCKIKEERNVMRTQYQMLEHSKLVNEEQIRRIEMDLKRYNDLPVEMDKKGIKNHSKEVKDIIDKLNNHKAQLESTMRMNESEMSRMEINFAVFDKVIAELNGN